MFLHGGAAYWSDKYKKAFTDIQSNIFKQSFSFSNLLKIWKYGKGHFLDYIRVVFRNEENKFISMTDRIFALYIQLMDLDIIVPVVSKVHNNGWDALGNSFKGKEFSGELLKSQKMYSEHREDNALHFEYNGNSHEYEKYNNDLAISISNSYESLWKTIKSIFIVVLKSFGKRIIPNVVLKIIRKIK